jgi:hypothetical protein
MSAIGRRQFCAALGGGLTGFVAVLLSGCGSGSDAAPSSSGADTVLVGISLDVRRDPG